MKRLALIIAVVLLATVVVAGSFWLKIRDGRTQVAQLQARVAELEAAPRPSAALPVPPPPLPAPAPVAKPVAAAPAAAAPARQQPAPAPASADTVAKVKQLMSSSAGSDMMRAVLRQQYPDLAKELGLTEAQANNLLDVFLRQQMDLSADSIGLLGGGTTDPNALREMARKVEEKQQANEAELHSLLGSKYADWQQYQATAAARQQVTNLQNALGAANALTADQSKSLLVSLAAAQSQLSAEQRNAPAMTGSNSKEVLENQLKQAEETTHRMLDAASPHLTFAQREIYKNLLEQNITMLRTIMQQLGGAPGQGGATR